MAVDIAKYVEQVEEKVTKDGAILEKFKKDPVKTVADLLGISLDADTLKAIASAVEGKLNLDDLAGKASDLLGGLKEMFK